MSKSRSREEIRRGGAYHEAAHAVVDVVEGHTVRYVSIETEGTDYQDICVGVVLAYQLVRRRLFQQPHLFPAAR